MGENSAGRTKKVNSEEKEARYHFLNEHFYEPGIMLRTLHMSELFIRTRTLKGGDYLCFQWGK